MFNDNSKVTLVVLWVGVFALLFTIVFVELTSQNKPRGVSSEHILPDRHRTPGASYPLITQANIEDTICSRGKKWRTRDIRPPMEYTQKLKRKQIEEYGYKDKDLRNYEEDHLIPLTLGGHPTDPKNLWPQSRLTKPLNAHHKDQVEIYLNGEVCARRKTLDEARKGIATDWVIIYHEMTRSGYIDPWAKRLRREP